MYIYIYIYTFLSWCVPKSLWGSSLAKVIIWQGLAFLSLVKKNHPSPGPNKWAKPNKTSFAELYMSQSWSKDSGCKWNIEDNQAEHKQGLSWLCLDDLRRDLMILIINEYFLHTQSNGLYHI